MIQTEYKSLYLRSETYTQPTQTQQPAPAADFVTVAEVEMTVLEQHVT